VALLYGVFALLLPQSAVEVLGVPLVVAGAYFGGVRGGLLTALWAILVTTVSFFVLHDVQTGYYAVSVVAYSAVGVGLGWAVERVVTQRRLLLDAMDHMQATQRQLRASQKRYRLLFEASNDAVYLQVWMPTASPRASRPSTTRRADSSATPARNCWGSSTRRPPRGSCGASWNGSCTRTASYTRAPARRATVRRSLWK
jgi:hypothetical protein